MVGLSPNVLGELIAYPRIPYLDLRGGTRKMRGWEAKKEGTGWGMWERKKGREGNGRGREDLPLQ